MVNFGSQGDIDEEQLEDLIEQQEKLSMAYTADDEYEDPYPNPGTEPSKTGASTLSLEDLKQGIAPEEKSYEEDPFQGGSETQFHSEEGIHDEVTVMVHTDKRYPHIEVLSMEDLDPSAAKLLASSLETGRTIVGKAYPVYFRHDDSLVELGECHQSQVKMLIRMIGEQHIVARLSEDKELSGKYIYALSN